MKPRLVQGLQAQDKGHVEAEFKSCPTFRENLIRVLEDEIQLSLSQMRDAAKGDVPNLPEYYADELSKQRTLEWVKSYLK
jgi:hypothetical protein